MLPTIATTITTSTVISIAATTTSMATTTGTNTTTTTPTTTSTSEGGRYSRNWLIALIVVLGMLGVACMGGGFMLVRIWLKQKAKHRYVSSISGTEG